MRKLTYQKLDFDDLDGWADDDHSTAFDVFKATCDAFLAESGLAQLRLIKDANDAREYFEDFFTPVLIKDGRKPLFTGYFEPEFMGSRVRFGIYEHPIYAVPDDLRDNTPYFSRQEIEQDDVLGNRGLEIAWLTNPTDRFFLQVQGSGRIRLPDDTVIRVGYAAKNGYDYTSIGKLLVQRNVFEPDEVSALAIRDWVTQNPKKGCDLFWENESYVFFKELLNISDDAGPLGTLKQPITAGRSIAVDPDITPLGSPVWIEKKGVMPLNCLVIAQDTGSAIKGAQRADIFFGTGANAGEIAGQTNDDGRMVVLLPNEKASLLLFEQS